MCLQSLMKFHHCLLKILRKKPKCCGQRITKGNNSNRIGPWPLFIINVHLLDINVSAKFYEIPSLPCQDNEKPKCRRWTDKRPYEWTFVVYFNVKLASARRGKNTPGQHHFLMYKNNFLFVLRFYGPVNSQGHVELVKNNLSLWQWYKAKSMDHEIYVTDPHIFYKVDLWVTLIHYPKYNISLSNSLQDMKSLDHKI